MERERRGRERGKKKKVSNYTEEQQSKKIKIPVVPQEQKRLIQIHVTHRAGVLNDKLHKTFKGINIPVTKRN